MAHLDSRPVTTVHPRLRATAAYLAVSAGLVGFASLEFMLEAIQVDFSLTPDQTIVVGQVSGGACLVAVFVVGALADRVGARRVLEVACIVAAAGAIVVGLSPVQQVLLIGLSISSIGTIAMAIIGLSELDRMSSGRARRARAFGAFAVIAPVVSIIIPLVAGVMVPHLGWRSVVTIWIGVAVCTFALTRRAVPERTDAPVRVELVTPMLAGVALAGLALTASFVSTNTRTREHMVHALICASTGVVAMVALIVVMRRRSNATLDVRSLRTRGTASIFAVVVIVNGVNLFFFTYLFLQYRYHQSLLATAMFLVLPQATAAAGAMLGGRLSARWGSARTATFALAGAAVLSSGALLVTAESSAWIPVLVLAVAAVPIGAAVGPITQSFMEQSPADGVAATSSWRTAAANLGVAVVGVLVGTLIFDGLDADTALDLAAYQQQADAFHLAGVFCVAAYAGAAVLVLVHARRRSQGVDGSPASAGDAASTAVSGSAVGS